MRWCAFRLTTCESGVCTRNTSTRAGSWRFGGRLCWRRPCCGALRAATATTPSLRGFSAGFMGAIAEYLRAVYVEALARGYRFNRDLIGSEGMAGRMSVTRGQIEQEWTHLKAKLRIRDPERAIRLETVESPAPHPPFEVVPGDVEAWEKAGAFRGS